MRMDEGQPLMDPQVETMLISFRTGYDSIIGMLADGEAKDELTQAFRRMTELAEACPDFMTFSTKAGAENLFMRYGEATTKASTALQMQMQEEKKAGKTRKITLTEYLKTYRGLLDQHKSKPHMAFTVRMHEKFLGVAENFSEDDIPGFLAEAERQGLLLKISTSGVYDEWAGNLRKLDPHDHKLIEHYSACAKTALSARSGEELDYLINREIEKYRRQAPGDEFRWFLILRLAGSIQDYEMSKLSLFATGDFNHYLAGLLLARRLAKDWYEMLRTHFNFDWDEYFAHPFNRKQVINQGFVLPDCMAVWESWHPDALSAMKQILFEEILPYPSLAEVVQRRPAGIPATALPEQKAQFQIDEKVAATARRVQPQASLPMCSAKPE